MKGPKPQARAGLEQFPMGGRVRHHARKHHFQRRIAEGDLLVYDAEHFLPPRTSPSPEDQRGRYQEAHPRRDPKPLPPKKRVAPESPKQGMASEFCNQWSEPGKADRIHKEFAVTQPKIARAIPLTTSIMPEGKNFLVFRKRMRNITTSARDTAAAIR